MGINTLEQLNDVDGTPMVQKELQCPECGHTWGKDIEMTVRFVGSTACMNVKAKAEEKCGNYVLGMRIHEMADLELSNDDKLILAKVVKEAWPTVVVGRMMEILDPEAVK